VAEKAKEAVQGEQKAVKELTASHKERDTLSQDYIVSLREQIALHAKERRQINDIRLSCFSALLAYQTSLIDSLLSLIKKFKNVAVPKVKGVSPKKAHSNTLTAPLEKLASSLREEKTVTEKQVGIAEKIKLVLDIEGLEKEEVDRVVEEAEKDLGLQGDEGWEASIDENCERLDEWLQSRGDEGAVEDE
jgi:hypothetical protein